ncbi:MAG: SBBP repeat-containing protein [Saprospiraceae bacterium]
MRIIMKSLLTYLIALLLTPLTSQQTSSGWVTTIAGSDWQIAADIKTDIHGNIYTIGSFFGATDFDGSAATNNKSDKGETDVFVTKHSPGGQLIWVATFGGSSTDTGFGIDIQDSGEVYVVGTFEGSGDFDPGDDVLTLSSSGQEDMFIAKLNSSGALIWAKRIGSTNVDEANDVAIDHDGNIYVVGRFVSTVDFDPGTATSNLTAGGAPDGFILKLNSQGEFLWAFDIGSGDNDEAEAVVVDGENNVIVTGYFDGLTDFDPGPGQHNVSSSSGSGDPFYLKLTPATAFVWVTTFTSSSYVFANDVDVDKDNNIVTHGFFRNSINPEPGNSATVILTQGAEDSFTAKINHGGDVAWLHTLGGSSLEFGYGVAVDALGDVYVTGFYYDSPDFDPGDEEFFLPSVGIEDTYLVKYNSDGEFVWVKQTGGTGSDAGYGIDINAGGDILLAGSYWGKSDLDPEPGGTLNITSKGSADVSIIHIDQMISSTTHESALTADWKLNPNPSTGELTISGVEQFPVTITVMDMTGRMLKVPYQLHSHGQMLDLHDLPCGIYYVDIRSADKSGVMKWIKN